MSQSQARTICFWPHTNQLGVASYRLRCHLVVSMLNGNLDGSTTKPSAFKIDIASSKKTPASVDVLVLSKRYDAKSIAHALSLKAQGTCIVLDVCDNHFVFDAKSRNTQENAEQFKKAIQKVDVVVASTEVLAAQIKTHCGPQIHVVVIDDPIESPRSTTFLQQSLQFAQHPIQSLTQHWQLWRLHHWLKQHAPQREHRFIWFGNHAGSFHEAGMSDLLRIQPNLEALHKQVPITLTVISNSKLEYQRLIQPWALPTHYIQWSAALLGKVLKAHGTVVIPISINPFTLAKTANRVTTALSHGLNVIADEIPSYLKYKQSICLGDWSQHLHMATSKAMPHAAASKIDVVAHNQSITQDWINLFKQLVQTH